MHSHKYSWQPAHVEITGRQHSSFKTRKVRATWSSKRFVWRECSCPITHPRHDVHISAFREKYPWIFSSYKNSGSSEYPEINHLQKHILSCIRGSPDFSHFEGRVPSAESQLSFLENLFFFLEISYQSPVSQTQAARVNLCMSSPVLSNITYLYKSEKWVMIYKNINSKLKIQPFKPYSVLYET